ncbi:hypothetical protein AN957_19075 [Cytobacillus solani]|uniref:Helix-turn-helix domain containing protein n=1 Tax=Cytobacillus solani TaxID=1637975 RepID=A0A0Q3VIW1_9BACI|nr:hypothetical protein AN957_19075 [Cytobacillus solani]
MHFEDATKEQLIQICLWEECSIDYKFEAARELQLREWNDDYLKDLVRLWGEGKSSFQIAIELGIDRNVVYWQLEKHGLYGRRITR